MISNEHFKSPENLALDQSEGYQEPAEAFSEEPADWSAEESSDDQAEQGWKKRISHDIFCRFFAEFNKPERASIRADAPTVGISFHTDANLSMKIIMGSTTAVTRTSGQRRKGGSQGRTREREESPGGPHRVDDNDPGENE